MNENSNLIACSRCGKCCADVLMATQAEIEKIKKYIKKYNIEPVNRNTIFDKKQKNICPFLKVDNTCAIYPVRLEICKNFSCKNSKKENSLGTYKNVKMISMMQTFFPKEYLTNSPFDLTYEQKLIEAYQKKIYKINVDK